MGQYRVFLALLPVLLGVAPHSAYAKPPVRADRFGDPLPPGAVARLGTTRLRHGGTITAIAYSADGKLLASASNGDDQVTVWEWPSGRRLRQFKTVGASGRLVFSRDGKRLASSTGPLGGTGTLRVWDIASGKELLRVADQEQASYPTAVAFSPDGKQLAAGWNTRGVRLWNLNTAKEIARQAKITDPVEALVYAASGKLMALVVEGKKLCLWDVKAAKRLYTFAAGEEQRGALAPDGRSLAVVGASAVISVYDADTGRERHRLRGHNRPPITCLQFSGDGQTLVSASDDTTIRVWNLVSGKQRVKLEGVPSYLAFPVLATDGKTVAVTRANGAHGVRLWDAGTGKPHDPFPGHASPVSSISVSPDGRLAATSSWLRDDPVVRLWEVSSGRLVGELLGHTGGVSAVAFAPDGKTLASCGWMYDGTVRIWEVRTGKQLHVLRGHQAGVNCLAFSRDGRRLASGDNSCNRRGNYEGRVCVWDAATGKLLRERRGQPGAVQALAFLPDNRTLLVARDGVHVWDTDTGRARGEPLLAKQRVWSVQVSPDGKVFAMADGSGPVRLWEVATRRQIWVLPPVRHAHCAVFSPNGRFIAVGTEGRVCLFDWPAAAERPSLKGWQGGTAALAFAPDGGRLLGASHRESSALVWDVVGTVNRHPAARGKAGPAALEQWLLALGGKDPAPAYQAVWELATRPEQSVPLLQAALRPVAAADAGQVARLVKNLDHQRFAVRERARRELEELGESVIEGLRRALGDQPSLEQRRRIEALLGRIEGPMPSRERLQGLRGVAVLEQIGCREARGLLGRLAAGAPGAILTNDAKAALGRMRPRAVSR